MISSSLTQAGTVFEYVRENKIEKVKRLLDNRLLDPNARNPEHRGMPLLHYARSKAMAKLLIRAGARLTLLDEEGNTLLHNNALWFYEDMVEFYLDSGMSPAIPNRYGHVAYIYTSEFFKPSVRRKLAKGLSPDLPLNEEEALYFYQNSEVILELAFFDE